MSDVEDEPQEGVGGIFDALDAAAADEEEEEEHHPTRKSVVQVYRVPVT